MGKALSRVWTGECIDADTDTKSNYRLRSADAVSRHCDATVDH
jgi:hypothetical protein